VPQIRFIVWKLTDITLLTTSYDFTRTSSHNRKHSLLINEILRSWASKWKLK